jgi:hypothetical protein
MNLESSLTSYSPKFGGPAGPVGPVGPVSPVGPVNLPTFGRIGRFVYHALADRVRKMDTLERRKGLLGYHLRRLGFGGS